MEAAIPSWDLLSRLGDEDVVVVDCRSLDEAERWPIQIPGSLRMTLQEIVDAPWALPDDELIVLFDANGNGSALRRAHQVLIHSGRSAVMLLEGLRGWLAAGFPTERMPDGYARGFSSSSASQPGHG